MVAAALAAPALRSGRTETSMDLGFRGGARAQVRFLAAFSFRLEHLSARQSWLVLLTVPGLPFSGSRPWLCPTDHRTGALQAFCGLRIRNAGKRGAEGRSSPPPFPGPPSASGKNVDPSAGSPLIARSGSLAGTGARARSAEGAAVVGTGRR